MPAKARAQCFQRPARNVVTMAGNNHIGRKDFGESGAEDDTLGIRSERKVEQWT